MSNIKRNGIKLSNLLQDKKRRKDEGREGGLGLGRKDSRKGGREGAFHLFHSEEKHIGQKSGKKCFTLQNRLIEI